MSDRKKMDTRRNEGSRGRDQGRDHARFGGENDRDYYGSDRSNDQDYNRRFNQDGEPSRQRYNSDQDHRTDEFSSSSYEGGEGSSPFRSDNDSTRQFQSTVSPFRRIADTDRMARTSRGGGTHLGSQMSESIYGPDETYQGNNLATGSSGRNSGGFSGKGPKGYERSDDRIKEQVCDFLADDDHIDASEIEVNVQKGEVTLTGTVSERFAKRHAEDLVEGIKGVRDVHNQIRVQASSIESMSQSHSSSAKQTDLGTKSDQSEKTERSVGQSSAITKGDGHTARH